MKIIEFITNLNQLLENESDLLVKKILYKCYYPKNRFNEIKEQEDLLLSFIFNYEVNNFDIAGIHLHDIEKVKEDRLFIYVGLYEGDDIVINKKDRSINIINHESNTIEKLASNSTIFLSNLLKIGKFNMEESTNDNEKMLLINNICEYEEAKSLYLTLIRYGF